VLAFGPLFVFFAGMGQLGLAIARLSTEVPDAHTMAWTGIAQRGTV
jgi:hypothetical protein